LTHAYLVIEQSDKIKLNLDVCWTHGIHAVTCCRLTLVYVAVHTDTLCEISWLVYVHDTLSVYYLW